MEVGRLSKNVRVPPFRSPPSFSTHAVLCKPLAPLPIKSATMPPWSRNVRVGMLDNHQFSLIIISVGLAAYLGSLTGWHLDQIDLLNEQLTTLNGHAVENKQQDSEISKKKPVAQMEEVTQQLRDLNKRLVQLLLASWLLVLFMALLAARILCWAWVEPANLAGKRVAGYFLFLDRAVVTTLAILLLYLTGFHVVLMSVR